MMQFTWRFAFFLLFSLPVAVDAQTLGGKAAYTFLKLPGSPLQAAAGGVNVSYLAGDVGLTAANPALLAPSVSQQVHAAFNALPGATKGYHLTGAYFSKKLQTTFGGHLSYLDYGVLPATDAAGNGLGEFRPVDYVVQVSAAKNYLQHWTYGLAVKWIHSAYGQYRLSAIAADLGILFHDTAQRLTLSVVVKNMGGQLNTYAGQTEELPFDLQAGITKRLAKSPLGFSLTAQQLQVLDILYRDTAFNRNNNFSSATSLAGKLLTHLVLAAHLYLGASLEATVGYNLLQRRELRVENEGNGFTGFSAGLRVQLPKLQIFYARTGYQRGLAANQVGLSVAMDRLFGLGKNVVVQ